jgi:hypothetical protein
MLTHIGGPIDFWLMEILIVPVYLGVEFGFNLYRKKNIILPLNNQRASMTGTTKKWILNPDRIRIPGSYLFIFEF